MSLTNSELNLNLSRGRLYIFGISIIVHVRRTDEGNVCFILNLSSRLYLRPFYPVSHLLCICGVSFQLHIYFSFFTDQTNSLVPYCFEPRFHFGTITLYLPHTKWSMASCDFKHIIISFLPVKRDKLVASLFHINDNFIYWEVVSWVLSIANGKKRKKKKGKNQIGETIFWGWFGRVKGFVHWYHWAVIDFGYCLNLPKCYFIKANQGISRRVRL